jgi:hypothetical protein
VLLREQGDAVVAIGQASHSWLSGQLARCWGNRRFPAPAPREEVCLAAEQHDIGMAEWDLRPALNKRTGRPRSFMELPVRTHIGLWTGAPAKLLSQSRYAALLVSMHGTALNERRNLDRLETGERRMVEEYLERQRELQRTLAREVAADADELARNQRLVWTWDSLSLALCLRWAPHVLERVPATDGFADLTLTETEHDAFTLRPWPFARDQVEVHCEGRLLRERYHSEDGLHRALEEAPSVRLSFIGRRP